METAKLDYGLDAPGVVKGFLIGGVALGVASSIAARLSLEAEVRQTVVPLLAWPAVCFMVTSFIMIWSSRFGKFRARDRLLDGLNLRGRETVLDLGCGRGLLLVGAAKRLPHGKAIGIDLWSQKDMASNGRQATLENARRENVDHRVEIVDGDMRRLPFADASVDAVIASMSIHNVPGREGRAHAVREAVRVLKRGGQVAFLDFQCTGEYVKVLEAQGMKDVKRSSLCFWNYPPSRIVTAIKA